MTANVNSINLVPGAIAQVANNLLDLTNQTAANNNLFVLGAKSPVVSANAITLDSTYLGSHVGLANAGTPYTVTLNQGTVGFITLWNAESSVAATVVPASGYIDGNSSYNLPARQSVTFYTDGANYSTMSASPGANAAFANQTAFADSITTPTITSNAVTLATSTYGGFVRLNNSTTAFAVTLPTNKVGTITLFNASGTLGIATVSAASGNINGSATLTLAVGASVTLYCDATNWFTISKSF